MDWRARRLYLIFTPSHCRADPFAVLDDALAAGVDLVQWRVPDPGHRDLVRCRAACDRHGVPLIVNDHVDLAVTTMAAGAHVGQDDMPAAAARRRLRTGQVLGVSTHDVAQAQRAVADGADHIGIGPCFPTATKGYEQGLDEDTLRAVLGQAPVPAFAIGGITAERIPMLRALGCRRVAVSSAVLAAGDVRAAVAELRRALSC